MRQRSITYWTPFYTASFTSTTHLTRAFIPGRGSYLVNKSQWIQRSKGVSRTCPKGHGPSQITALSRTLETQKPFTIAASLRGLRSTYLVIVEHSWFGGFALGSLRAPRQ
jgi:hypothetical protein